jgi:hypothetical protein
MIVYNLIWGCLFFGALAYTFLINPIPSSWWPVFWKVWLYFQVIVGIPTCIWFLIGGTLDVKYVFRQLATIKRNDADDGTVIKYHHLGEEGMIAVDENEVP